MAVIIKKNTVDISSSFDWRGVELTQVLTNEVSKLKVRIKNYGSKSTIALGDQIDVYEDGVHIFGGTAVSADNVVEGGILIATVYTVLDWSFRLNSKMVVRRYQDMDPRDIIIDILANFTDGTFTYTNVQAAGFNLNTIKFNYVNVTAALQKLATQIGWEWYVDADKDVHFFPPSLVVDAPFDVDDTSGNQEWPTIDIDQNLQNMKNSIIVIGGTYVKSYDATTTPDQYVTDGIKSVFPLAYPYDQDTMVVTLAGVSQTIGTDQVTVESTVQVLYSDSGRFIRFTTVPTIGQTVKIYGDAKIPIVAQSSSQDAIDAYGEIQDAVIDPQISSIEEAQDRANAEIARYGSPVYTIRFSTLQTGLVVGQTIRVNSTKFNTDVNVSVKRIYGRMYSPDAFRYTVECVGTERVSFVDIMKLLLLQANSDLIVDDSSVLQVLISFNEDVAITDSTETPTTSTGPYLWGTGTLGFMSWNA